MILGIIGSIIIGLFLLELFIELLVISFRKKKKKNDRRS